MPKKNQKIELDLTYEDLEDLRNGRDFNWTFPTNTGEQIDIHLFNEEAE